MLAPRPSPLGIPAATYRLQFSHQFTFAHAAELVPYLRELGISECYASPILTARPGSPHGYDTVDPERVSAELGGEKGLKHLARRLREAGLGLIVDIVPNHMCVTDERNRWWQDVLEHGAESRFAEFFDIDWEPPDPDLRGKVLLPVLGGQLRHVIAAGQIALAWHEGALRLRVYDQHLPICLRAWPLVLRPLAERAEAEAGARDLRVVALRAMLADCEREAASPRAEPGPTPAVSALRERLRDWAERSPRAQDWLEDVLAGFRGEAGLDALPPVLLAQHYRLAFWRHAAHSVNYRRFFDINDLAGLRVEVPRVFEAVHGTILRLIEAGCITGLRVDHPDGLHNPPGYIREVQARCAKAAAASPERIGLRMPGAEAPFYIVVEKILGPDEALREDWPVHGTTGYEFLNQASHVFIVPEHERAFKTFYRRFITFRGDTTDLLHECKRLVLEEHFRAELERLARRLAGLFPAPAPPQSALRGALTELIAAFPVYRGYVNGRPVRDEDRLHIEQARQEAERRNPHIRDLLERLGALLSLAGEDELLPGQLEFVAAFQQLTGPVMAKGLEDTALYRYFPLISTNTVGGAPGRFGLTAEQFHEANRLRQKRHPFGLSATSTHDTKRSEDVRARINALSEIPQAWMEAVERWMAMNGPRLMRIRGEPAPDPNEEYLLYQTLAGAWPLGGTGGSDWAEFPERIRAYMIKALREAKVHTSWAEPNAQYEIAVGQFAEALLTPRPDNPFPADMEAFLAPVMRAGLWNALSRTVLKVASPGVPDFYQGTELWDFSLVDPDNRRPVDFSLRKEMLAALERDAAAGAELLVDGLLRSPEDGRIKLYVTSRLLRLRARARELFTTGAYLPLAAEGAAARHVIAFARAEGARRALVATGRFFLALAGAALPVGEGVWSGTALRLLPGWEERRFRDIFTGRILTPLTRGGLARLSMADLFGHLPVTLLEGLDE
jgi:(1->4)-alpha-D-glucan 1-alpha-D-glucosylmutase